MANRVILEKEIKEYCKLNDISDVGGFITQCMLKGFNIIKYGTSPQDNIKRENNEVETVPNNRSKPKEENGESKIIVKKHKVKIINK